MKIGVAIINGIVQGVYDRLEKAIDAIVKAALAMLDAALRAIGARSPSTEFMKVGQYMMEGMALGIERNAALPAMAMRDAMGDLIPSAASAGGVNGSGGAGGAGSVVNNFSFVVNDRESMAMALAYVDTQRRARLNATMGG